MKLHRSIKSLSGCGNMRAGVVSFVHTVITIDDDLKTIATKLKVLIFSSRRKLDLYIMENLFHFDAFSLCSFEQRFFKVP